MNLIKPQAPAFFQKCTRWEEKLNKKIKINKAPRVEFPKHTAL